jgi:hypothetical protein
LAHRARGRNHAARPGGAVPLSRASPPLRILEWRHVPWRPTDIVSQSARYGLPLIDDALRLSSSIYHLSSGAVEKLSVLTVISALLTLHNFDNANGLETQIKRLASFHGRLPSTRTCRVVCHAGDCSSARRFHAQAIEECGGGESRRFRCCAGRNPNVAGADYRVQLLNGHQPLRSP